MRKVFSELRPGKSVFRMLTTSLLLTFFIFSGQRSSAQSQDEMKAWMNYATPGDIHKMMAKSVGVWTGNVSMWMKPGAAPMTTVTEGKNEMILGGRYLQSTNTGNFMGQPFEGIGVTGYDNAKKAFVYSWIDNMGTGMILLTGSWDDASKSIVFTGTEVDPLTGKDKPIKEILRFIDDNNQVMEMYNTADGKEYKSMEIKLTRKS